VPASNLVYQNTRKMILAKAGNPYYLTGDDFSGIGGPHVGLTSAWPMSVLVQAMTSDDDEEIMRCLNAVKNVSRNGLIHESVNVDRGRTYTRSWFAWANSVFAQTVLDLSQRKPHLLFGKGAEPYTL
jgi:meiotically up-regulated gene 157 (Mug157) protein